jgi:peptidoglycan/LPS O-acetylase OafA/YrhL
MKLARPGRVVEARNRSGTRFLPSGAEAGTAPEDRKFRPDVEGLRAVAVLVVVLYHAGVPRLGGGYVGVDVFFVISGFVITGLLLRERAANGKTGLLAFYGRRCRRILPAASFVILVTSVASYHWLGFIRAGQVMTDAQDAALFVANFHFINIGANYLTADRPPSPLQNLWSLSVEEQFYLVYPTLFILIATLGRKINLRVRLAAALTIVVMGSFAWSIYETETNGIVAYFSPLTHAWELALGGLIAVETFHLAKVPRLVAGLLTWVGLGLIIVAATFLTDLTAYPGWAVSLPVLGAALIIAGGAACPPRGVELLLGLAAVRWIGKLSYSLYLWHWPILAIAAQQAGRTLSVRTSLLLLLVALGLSIITFYAIENPIRHAKVLARYRLASIGLGAALTALSLGVVSIELHTHA